MNIVPAILSENFEHVVHTLFRVEGLTKRVQIDICDGVFGLERTWLPKGTEELPHGFLYEFDVMVVDWKKYVPRCLSLGASRIVVHADTFNQKDIVALLDMVAKDRIMLGIAVSETVPIETHIELIDAFYEQYPHIFIQVMGIRRIGAQGQSFDRDVLSRIKKLKKLFPFLLIQVDGSMNQNTVVFAHDAGADTAIVGSYIFNGERSIRKSIDTLTALTAPKRK
jgi:ribulose-phosphate 3-epimerase